MAMTFYDSKFAPNARRVRIFLAEKGLRLPTVQIDLGAKEHQRAEYRRINPFLEVPALALEDGSILTESIAICRYLEALHPEPNLFGRDARAQAEIEMWQRRLEIRLMFPVALAFRHGHPGMAALETPQISEVSAFGRTKALAFLELLDGVMAGRPFAAGDEFSVADITGMVSLDFLKMARIGLSDQFTNLIAWRDRLQARPSHGA